MAITLRGVNTSANSGAGSISIPLPTGTTTGDVTLLWCLQGGTTSAPATTGTLSPPSGWTTLWSAVGALLCYRVFQSGDPSSVTATSTNSTGFWECGSIAYTGCDTTTPIDASNGCAFVSVTPVVSGTVAHAPAVAPGWNGDQLVVFYGFTYLTGASFTTPGGLTVQAHSGSGPSYSIFDLALSSAVTTGTYDSTTSASTANTLAGVQVALKASGATAATQSGASVTLAGRSLNQATSTTTPSVAIGTAGVQVGDLVVLMPTGGAVSAAPSGYTAAQSGTDGAVYYKTFAGTDSLTPSFTMGGTFNDVEAVIFRATAGGTVKVDTSGLANVTASTTAVAPSLTPTFTNDQLLLYYARGSSTGVTITGPSGTSYAMSSNFGPSWLIGLVPAPSNPTGTFTATYGTSGAGSAISLLVGIQTGVNVTLTGQKATGHAGALTSSQALSRALTAATATGRGGVAAAVLAPALTHVAATGHTGTITSSQALSRTLSSVAATAHAGALTSSQALSRALTAATATGHTGAATAILAPALAHVTATGTPGTLTSSQALSRALTDVAATGTTGTITSSQGKSFALSGVAGTAQAGALSPALAPAAGSQHVTGTPGSVTASKSTVLALSGVRSLGTAGQAIAGITAQLAARHATGTSGTVEVLQGLVLILRGEHAAGRTGALGITTSANPTLTGVRAHGTAGTPEPVSAHSITGRCAAGATGSLGSPDITVSLAGLTIRVRNGILGVGDTTGPRVFTRSAPLHHMAINNPQTANTATEPPQILGILPVNNMFVRT